MYVNEEIEMKNPEGSIRRSAGKKRLVAVLFLFVIAGATALPSSATTPRSRSTNALGIVVVNNSNREIRHLYLTPVDQNAWGADLLDGTVVRRGESFTITDAACQGNEIKVVAEDQQGCFMYGVVSCAQANSSWTITDDTVIVAETFDCCF